MGPRPRLRSLDSVTCPSKDKMYLGLLSAKSLPPTLRINTHSFETLRHPDMRNDMAVWPLTAEIVWKCYAGSTDFLCFDFEASIPFPVYAPKAPPHCQIKTSLFVPPMFKCRQIFSSLILLSFVS